MPNNTESDAIVTVKIDEQEQVTLLLSQLPATVANAAKAYVRNGGDPVLLLSSLSTQILDIDGKIKLMQRLARQVNR